MTAETTSDLIVVGGGIAGLVAANRARELGLATTLVEQGEGDRYLCNSRMTGGVFHIAFHDVTGPAAGLRAAIDAATAGHADAALADALAEDAGRAVEWLSGHGARFIRGGAFDWMSRVLTPPGLQRPGLAWQGRGGDVLLRDLAARFTAAGGRMRTGTRAVGLMVEDGRCAGLAVEHGGGREALRARAVLIADGGFQGNAELVRRHISPRPEALCTRGGGTGRGDGLLMAEAAGAKLVEMGCFYGHVQCLEAIGDEALWPYPILDLLTAAGILVDAQGRRFADEGLGGVAAANAIARLDRPDAALVVFDEAIWQGPGRDYLIPPNPNILDAGVKLVSAPTLAELAAKTGMDPAVLAATVEAHNAALAQDRLQTLDPPRSNPAGAAMPVTGPFHALRVCAGITYTMGGIATDADGRVRHRDGGTVGGLFAAGSAAAGIEGGSRAGYVGGLTKAVVFALRAAECAARKD